MFCPSFLVFDDLLFFVFFVDTCSENNLSIWILSNSIKPQLFIVYCLFLVTARLLYCVNKNYASFSSSNTLRHPSVHRRDL